MPLDPNSPTPIYVQLKALLMDEILLGRYGLGVRVPTEHEICDLYRISRTPVARALGELANEGVLQRRRGVGTFVDPEWLKRSSQRAGLHVVVQEGPWADIVHEAAIGDDATSVLSLPRTGMREAIARSVAEGNAPDLAILDTVWVPELAASGSLYSLEELDDAWVRLEHDQDFLPPLIEASRVDERTYGVVLYAIVSGLWLGPVGSEPDVSPPRTWAELRACAQSSVRDGMSSPIAMTGGLAGGETTAFSLLGWLASNDARVFGEGQVCVDSVETVQTLRFLRSLLDGGLISDEAVGYEWDRPAQLLAEGRATVSLGGSYEAPALADALGVSLGDLPSLIRFIPFPAGPHGTRASVAGGMSCCVFRQSRNPRLAMRLLERIVSPQTLARPVRAAGRIPARRSAIELAAPHDPFLAQTAEMFKFAVNQPSTPSYPRVSVQLQAMLEAVLTRRLGATAAARQAGETIGAIVG